MIRFLRDLPKKFLNQTITKKIITIVLLLLYITVFLSVLVKVNVEVMTPGVVNGIAYTNDDNHAVGVLKIDTNNKSGNIFTVGIYSHQRVSLFQYLISKFSNDITFYPYNPKTDLTEKEEIIRGEIHRDFSLTHALIVGYEAASVVDSSIHIEYELKGLIVSAVLPYSQSALLAGDIITHLEGEEIINYVDFVNKLTLLPNKNAFAVTVIRNNQTKIISAKKVENAGSYKIGIEASEYYIIDEEKTTPKFIISKNIPSLGSSGGAMTALAIYNALLPEDITNNKRIAGTGSIKVNGEVGDIGGVEQKIVTAVLYNIDIFFVYGGKYPEAKAKYDEINAQYQLVEINTFDDILSALRGDNNE